MTPYKVVFDSFMDLIVRDDTFLIKNPDEHIVVEVANETMMRLLRHAVSNMMWVKDTRNFEIDFMNILNDLTMEFNEDLTKIEVDILAYFMLQCYIEEEVMPRLKALKTLGFSDDEIKSFSPANSIKQYSETLSGLKNENANRVIEYKRRGRNSFKLKPHGYIFE